MTYDHPALVATSYSFKNGRINHGIGNHMQFGSHRNKEMNVYFLLPTCERFSISYCCFFSGETTEHPSRPLCKVTIFRNLLQGKIGPFNYDTLILCLWFSLSRDQMRIPVNKKEKADNTVFQSLLMS